MPTAVPTAGWRNPSFRGDKLVVIARVVHVDAERFIKEDLDADETSKISRMPGWRYVDREGAEIQSLRLDGLNEQKAKLEGEITNTKGVLADRQRRLDDVLIAINAITKKAEVTAVVEAAKPINLDDLNFNELKALCVEKGIVVAASERDRKKLIAALTPIVNPTPPTPAS